LEATVTDADLREEIYRLLEAKRAGAELDRGPKIEAIGRFIDIEMHRLGNATIGKRGGAPPVDLLNDLFRDTLAEVWNSGTD